jgi:glycosyltransferase involved in cell wall biosynthesis
MSTPLISVIMPVYNAGRFLAPAIESIRNQTLGDFEFIIVNDGSTDGSLSVISKHAAEDSRIRVISRPNAGLVRSLNEGLEAAQGRYIARMDADDLCDPRRFELQVRRLESEPDLVALGSCARAIDPRGRNLGLARVPLEHDQIEKSHLAGVSAIHHPAVMMRRNALAQVGGYRDLCPTEDFDLWLRLGEVGRLANLAEPLLIKRQTIGGAFSSQRDRWAAAVQRSMQDAWQRRGLPGQPEPPVLDVMSRGDVYRQWGWMALQSRHRVTSRLYAARAVLREPLSRESWRLFACSIRGH